MSNKLMEVRKLCCGPHALRLAIPYHQQAPKVKYMLRKSQHGCTIRRESRDGIMSKHSRNDADEKSYKLHHRFDIEDDFPEAKSYCTCGVGHRMVCSSVHMTASSCTYYITDQIMNQFLPKQLKSLSI